MTTGETAAELGASVSGRHWLDAERIRVYSWMFLTIFGIGYVVWLGLSLPDLVDPRGKVFGNDFIAVWSAARLAVSGPAAVAYDWPTLQAVELATVPALPYLVVPWVYPPPALLMVLPLGFLSYPAALAVFLVATTALWAALVRAVLPDPRAWIVAAATPAGMITVMIGQNSFLTVGLAGFGLLWLERRPILAGVLIGMLVMKPHLALLFPVALVAAGRWRTIIAAAATAAGLTAASLAVFGWDTFAAFVDHMPATRLMIDSGAVSWGLVPTPYVFALSLQAPIAAATALQGLTALVALVCVWRAWRSEVPFEAKAAILAAGSLLASPYLSYYDMTWAALALGWLSVLGLRSGFLRGEREIYLFVWLVPLLMPPLFALTSVQIGFPALFLLLLMAAVRAAVLPRVAMAAFARTSRVADQANS